MLFNQYPYLNLNDFNLDYLLRTLRDLSVRLENFIALNTIKYANPIQWRITNQYEANTVVIDDNDGTAYLSIVPVPKGVAITNNDYWMPIFTLNLLSANQNITLRDDSSNVLATFASVAGDWLIWNNTLYRVTQAINTNEAYVVGYNLERFSVELFIKDYINNIVAMIGDLNDLTTTDKDSIVDAINELVDEIGDLTSLATTDKTSIVNAINEVVNTPKGSFVNVRDFGAVGDAEYYNKTDNTYYSDAGYTTPPTDDGAAFDAAIAYALANNIHVVYVPKGYFYLPNKSFNLSDSGVTFKGDTNSFLVSAGLTSGAFIDYEMGMTNTEYLESPITIEGVSLLGSYFTNDVIDTAVIGISLHGNWQQRRSIDNVSVSKFSIGINFVNSCENHIEHCAVALCNIGLRFAALVGYNPIPAYIDASMVEMCARGIYAPNGGYSEIYISNSGLAGGRQIYAGKAQLYISNCRSEIGLNDCCNNSGAPVYPIDIYGTESADSNSGVNISNSEFLTEDTGYAINCGFFVDVPHYTRNSQLDAYIRVSNPHNTSGADAVINNCMYTIGAQPVVKLVRANRIMQNNNRTTIYDNKAPLIGQNMIPVDKLPDYDSNIVINTGAGVIDITNGASITLPITKNDSVVISRFVPASGSATITHQYYANNVLIGTTTATVNASPTRTYDDNAASSVVQGADKVVITISPAYFIYDTNEYNYSIEIH